MFLRLLCDLTVCSYNNNLCYLFGAFSLHLVPQVFVSGAIMYCGIFMRCHSVLMCNNILNHQCTSGFVL